MAQGSKRSKKGLLNNPIVLVMILLLFAVVGAMQFGLLDTLFGATPEPSAPPKPAHASTPAAPNSTASAQAPPETQAGIPAEPSGSTSKTNSGTPQVATPTQTSAKPVSNPGTAGTVGPAAVQGNQAQSPKSPQDQKTAESKKTVPQRPKVPEFSFAVGRSNPFANLAGVSANPSTSAPSTTSQPVRKPQPAGSGDAGTKPGIKTEGQAEAKPKAPWESWQYTGLSSYGKLRIAIIETPTTSYIVKVGDRIEGVWLVEEITSDRVVLKSSERSLVLVLGGDKK